MRSHFPPPPTRPLREKRVKGRISFHSATVMDGKNGEKGGWGLKPRAIFRKLAESPKLEGINFSDRIFPTRLAACRKGFARPAPALGETFHGSFPRLSAALRPMASSSEGAKGAFSLSGARLRGNEALTDYENCLSSSLPPFPIRNFTTQLPLSARTEMACKRGGGKGKLLLWQIQPFFPRCIRGQIRICILLVCCCDRRTRSGGWGWGWGRVAESISF